MATFKYPDGRVVEGPDRCEVTGDTVTPCVPLEAIIKRERRRQQPRVKFGELVSFTRNTKREVVVLDLGATLQTELRFCFICGARIDGAERTPDVVQSAGGT